MDLNLQQKHEKAQRMYDKKMKALPAALFHDRRRPTLYDFYAWSANWETAPTNLFLKHIPDDLQLSDYLALYEEVVLEWGKRVDKRQPLHIARLIWFYGLDFNHTMVPFRASTKLNVVLTSLLVFLRCVFPEHAFVQEITESQGLLAYYYLSAWMNGMRGNLAPQEEFIKYWHQSEHDIIVFGDKQMDIMQTKLHELKNLDFPANFPQDIRAALDQQFDMNSSDFLKYGPALAFRFHINELRSARSDLSMVEFEHGYTAGAMGEMAMNEKVDEDALLRNANWEDPILVGLMMDIDETIVSKKVPVDYSKCWMNPQRAVTIMDTSVADIQTLLEKLQF